MKNALSWFLNTVALRAVFLGALIPTNLRADDAPAPIRVQQPVRASAVTQASASTGSNSAH